MYVAVCRLDLHIRSSQSLKEKRRVVRSVIERVRNKFGASVAEVASQDKWQLGGSWDFHRERKFNQSAGIDGLSNKIRHRIHGGSRNFGFWP